jgi:hypothetical protein
MRRPNDFVKNAFIIRPFGVKDVPKLSGKKEEALKINFDAIDEKLISPALDALGISGRTTIEIVRAGNIREDMFHRLLTADLVIADLSIHNANVFYELGLRHAFRSKYTFLIRCEGLSNYPFDLQTDRYFVYDYKNPGRSLGGLIEALKQTISSDAEDSPVYKLLPALKTQDRSRFLAPPREFREAIIQARKAENPGDLRLLAVEAEGFIWEIEGLREVGRAQFELNYHWSAAVTWEAIRRHYPDDLEANLMLTRACQRIYEHSGEERWLEKSLQALSRVSEQTDLERIRRSEVLGLIGRKHQTEWRKSWEKAPEKKRFEQALSSHYLREARRAYENAFYLNLNNYNAGVNALALLMVEEQLAKQYEEVWRQLHESPEEEVNRLTGQVFKLRSSVELSLEAERKRIESDPDIDRDFWLELNEAGYYLLVLPESQSVKLRREFDEALRLAPPAWVDAIEDMLDIYQKLDLFSHNVSVVRSVFDASAPKRKWSAAKPRKVKDRILLFAGHRVDQGSEQNSAPASKAARSKTPRRFPRGKEFESKVRKAIEAAVKEELAQAEQEKAKVLFAICGGANGGEIIFHEVCRDLGISTHLYLAIPRDQFVGRYVSVFTESNDWFDRFNDIYRKAESTVELSDSDELPRWLQLKPNYDLRRRGGLWMLQHALVNRVAQDAHVTMIALWDGHAGDAAGGIDDLINRALDNGINVVPIPTGKIFD